MRINRKQPAEPPKVAIEHDASEVLGYAGCALPELGDAQRGTELLERAIENDPSNAQAWVSLGRRNALSRRWILRHIRVRRGAGRP